MHPRRRSDVPKTKQCDEGKSVMELSMDGYATIYRNTKKGLKWSMSKLKKSLKK